MMSHVEESCRWHAIRSAAASGSRSPASVVAAVVGSMLLAMRDSGKKTTKLGVTATLPVPGHPGAVIAGLDALWVALRTGGDRRSPPRRRHQGGGAVGVPGWGGFSPGARRGPADRLGPALGSGLAELAFSIGAAAPCWTATGSRARRPDRPPGQRVVGPRGTARDAAAARPRTLEPASAPLPLSPGRTLALASGGGYLWVTAADAGEVLRIDPATHAIKRAHVGGFPIGIVLTGGSVWFADQEGGKVVRLDPRSLLPVGKPIRVGTKPSWLAAAAGSLFVTDQDDGTVVQIDVHSGKKVGLPIRIAPTDQKRPRSLGGPRRTVRLGEQLCLEHAHSHQLDSRPRRPGRRGNGAHRG